MKKVIKLAFLILLLAQPGLLKAQKNKEIKGDDISGPLHQKYMGKIVFSKKAENLAYQKEVESEFQNEFTLGEPLYLRAYYDNTLYNHLVKLAPKSVSAFEIENGAKIETKFFLDDVLIYDNTEKVLGFESNYFITKWITFENALQASNGYYYFARCFKDFIHKCDTKLTPGNHTVRMEIYPVFLSYGKDPLKGEILASGSFTLKINEKVFDPNDEKLCAPAAKMSDKALETKMGVAYNDFNTKHGRKHELKEVRITSDGWELVKNQNSGALIKRKINAAIVSTVDGKCQYEYFEFDQEYEGQAYQDKIVAYSASSCFSIPCACLQK